jgi:hypothetical protein
MPADATPPDSILPLVVVILNWNLPDETIACVDSVLAAALPGVAVLVVDSGSRDGSVARLRQQYGERVALLALPYNGGFAAGMNAGIRHALAQGAQSVLLLNNDTVVAPDMIAELIAAAQREPAAGIWGPLIYYYDWPERIWHFADREYAWLPLPLRLSPRVLKQAGGQPLRVDYVTGCAMLVRRAVFEQVGLLDERYIMYFEDADFCRRARMHGFPVWCVPGAQMWHKVSLSARIERPGTRYLQAWGRAYFLQRHPRREFPGLIGLYVLFKTLLVSLHDIWLGEGHLLRPLWRGTLEGRVAVGPTALVLFWRDMEGTNEE